MRANPYPDEPTRAQPTDVLPQKVPMEDLPPRPVQSQLPPTPTVDTVEVESAETRQEEARTVRYAISKLSDFLQWFMAVLEATLIIRFFLRLIGADPANLFAGFLYALTDIILFPFHDIVHDAPLSRTNPQAIEWATLIAMIIYWLIFWAIRRFLRILISTPEEPAS